MEQHVVLSPAILSPNQVSRYHEAGYIVVKGFLDNEPAVSWKEVLKSRLIEAGEMDEPSGVRVWMANEIDPLTHKHVCENIRLVGALQQLMGSPNVEFLSIKAVFKNSITSFASPWHQDWCYWKGATKISVWIALDDADQENGCLKMSPGSHGQLAEASLVNDGKGFVHRLSDEMIAGIPVETLPVKRGDVVFFHDLTLHASCPNMNGRERFAAIATYRDGGCTDDSTVWKAGVVLSGSSVNTVQPVG